MKGVLIYYEKKTLLNKLTDLTDELKQTDQLYKETTFN
jgi:hypothetical protein